jgi:hypothetical protein
MYRRPWLTLWIERQIEAWSDYLDQSSLPIQIFIALISIAVFLIAEHPFGVITGGGLIVAGVVGVEVLKRHRRRRVAFLIKNKICLQCGYDLRASIERCPECGTSIPHPESIDESIN